MPLAADRRRPAARAVVALIHDPLDPNRVFLGTGDGVYVSTDRGESFVQLTRAGMTSLVVSDLAIHPLDPNWLYAACHDGGPGSGGVFKIRIGPVSGAWDRRPPPAAGLVLRNHPNPFNPRTVISFEIPAAGNATLSIYDSRGRLVANLLDRWCAAGAHTAPWAGMDARGATLPSGQYFARLSVEGGLQRALKMTLLR